MSASSTHEDTLAPPFTAEALPLAATALPAAAVLGCALLAGAAPLGVSLVAVFLFAGPHNWLEARYFLTRMPARWGRLAPFFSLGLAGTLILGGLFASLPWLAGENSEFGLVLVAVWNSLLTAWIVSLALLRSRQNPRRDWPLLIPFGFVLIAATWLWPLAWSLALVYLHPLLALAFLDRELQRRRSAWRKPFRCALLLIPLCLAGMAARLAGSPDLPGTDPVSWQITHHAGAEVIPRISTHFLVGAHLFLELLHYLVWIAAIPSLSLRNAFSTQGFWRLHLWKWADVPPARRSPRWRRLLTTVALGGGVVLLVLWGAFLTDYGWTRNVYFTVAILHVLAEIPFLLRSL